MTRSKAPDDKNRKARMTKNGKARDDKSSETGHRLSANLYFFL